MELKCLQIGNEKLAVFCCCDKNRRNEIYDYQKKVMDYFDIPINYLDFVYNHGFTLESALNNILNAVDYVIFLDVDAIPLKKDFISICYSKILDKNTLYGGIQSANHKDKNHCYVGVYFMCLSTQLYKDLGRPSFSDTFIDCDCGEMLTRECEKQGKNVCFANVSSFHKLTEEEQKLSGNPEYWNLGNGQKFGLGAEFNNLVYHNFMNTVPRAKELFINKAKEVLGEDNKDKKLEAVIVCKNYSDYLELTLKENHKYFDNIIIVGDSEDTKLYEVTKKYPNVERYYYTDWNKNGAKFNFGGARNFGLSKLKYNQWVIIMDSDICIMEDFKNKLIDKDKFHGSYRRFIPTKKHYDSLFANRLGLDELKKIEGSGCGFFQCLHYDRLKEFNDKFGYMYPDSYSAEQVDIDFLRQFCSSDGKNYHDLVRMNIELWHLGEHGIFNEGRDFTKDTFFNN